jgi:hypothetical protein
MIKFYKQFFSNIFLINKNINKFSTSSISNINKNISKMDDNYFYSDQDSNKTDLSLVKAKAVKDFKNIYGDGYLGYSQIHNLGDVSYLINSDLFGFTEFIKNIEFKLKDYLNYIPENTTFSILR